MPYHDAVKVLKTALDHGANFWNGASYINALITQNELHTYWDFTGNLLRAS